MLESRSCLLTYVNRMFTSSLTEEVRVLEEEIEAVKDKVDDPIMCAKVRQFVYAPREIQEMFKADAGSFLDFFIFSSCDGVFFLF